MTEAEWLACDEPMRMYSHLEQWSWVPNGAAWTDRLRYWVRDRLVRNPLGPRRAAERRLYLLACGANRATWDKFGWCSATSTSLELEERFADGEVTLEELLADNPHRQWWWDDAWHLVSNVFRQVIFKNRDSYCLSPVFCDLTRCVFGNPFRPAVALDPRWRTSTVLALAAGIYAERAFDRMPILADALQDAACENPDVLGHCRTETPHCRGCWVVDLALGKP